MALALSGSAYAQDDLLDDLESDAAESASEPPPVTEPEPPIEEVEAAPAAKPAEEKPARAEDKAPKVDPRSLDRIKAVPKKPMLKRGRLELTPLFSFSLNDAYYQHLAVGGSLIYYVHDAFGIGLGAEYLFAHEGTNNLQVIRESATSVPAIFEQPRLFAHLDLYWVPMYGKLSLFDSGIIHFDFYTVLGGGIATAFGSERPAAANVGVGQRFTLGDWLALRVEVRDHLYVATQQVNGLTRSDIQSHLLFYVGASFFVPPSFEYTYQ